MDLTGVKSGCQYCIPSGGCRRELISLFSPASRGCLISLSRPSARPATWLLPVSTSDLLPPSATCKDFFVMTLGPPDNAGQSPHQGQLIRNLNYTCSLNFPFSMQLNIVTEGIRGLGHGHHWGWGRALFCLPQKRNNTAYSEGGKKFRMAESLAHAGANNRRTDEEGKHEKRD